MIDFDPNKIKPEVLDKLEEYMNPPPDESWLEKDSLIGGIYMFVKANRYYGKFR